MSNISKIVENFDVIRIKPTVSRSVKSKSPEIYGDFVKSVPSKWVDHSGFKIDLQG